MSDERAKRRLAAVLALDVAGYSRLMEEDEEGTFGRLTAVLRDVVEPSVREGEGRIVKTTGDGALVEFRSVLAAANTAVAIQRKMAGQETQDAGGPIQFRIGIHLCEVISERGDIYGDGVNVAARLEALAEPGGICVSQLVAEQVAGKVDADLVDLGENRLKNIARPMRIFRLVGGSGATTEAGRRPALTPIISGFEGRPAVAVLPFRNVTGDAEQEYFADGLTEDITSALARWRSFPVIACDSAFTYKGVARDIRRVGRELGVRYVVEGSVRGDGRHVRVSAQLVDALSTHHLHAEHYDREITDKFGVHDDVVLSIVGTLEPELLRVERERVASQPPANNTAYDLLQRGLWHHYRRTRQDSAMAQAIFRNALAVDPDYAQALAALSVCLTHGTLSGWESDGASALAQAVELGRRAVFLDSRDPFGHFALGVAILHDRQIDFAISENQEAVRLNPSYAAAHACLGFLNNYVNHPRQALQSVSRALRFSPNDPRQFLWVPALVVSHYLTGEYEQAIQAGWRGMALKPDYPVTARYLAAALGQLGRTEEAASLLPVLCRLHGNLEGAKAYMSRYFVDRSALEHLCDGLRKAGFS